MRCKKKLLWQVPASQQKNQIGLKGCFVQLHFHFLVYCVIVQMDGASRKWIVCKQKGAAYSKAMHDHKPQGI